LDNFYLSICDEKYCKVNYAQKEGLNIGHIYAQGPCIFKLDCKIRNSLLAKNYHDIDIENCHPRIVEQLAKKLNLPHKAISDYIDRRECWFESIKGAHGYDRNKAKTLMLRLLYLGNYYEQNKIPFVVKYAKELTGIAKQLWKDADKKTKKLVKDEVKKKKKNDIKLKDSKATLMSWRIQSIECSILLKIHKWFTDNNYNVGQFCHDGLTIERNKYNPHPNILPEDVIEEVNNEINEIGGEYNYDGYTVTLSKKIMEIKDLGDIVVDPNVLPPRGKKKVPAKITKGKCSVEIQTCTSSSSDAPKIVAAQNSFSKPSTHRTAIYGCGHIPYKITCQDEFKEMVNEILDEDGDNFFLNEYPHCADDVPYIYSLDFDWHLSDTAIDSILDTLAECTKDGNRPSYFIARNEESNKIHIYVRMICKCEVKIGVLTKGHDLMWENLKDLDEDEIDFSREEWYSKIFDIKAPGLCSIYSVKKSGKGEKNQS